MKTVYSSIRLRFTEFTSKPDAAGKEKTTSAVTWRATLALLSVTAIASAGGALAADGSGSLVDHVRAANDRFKNVSVAVSEGYTPMPCASGADGGAMGIHYVNAKLIGADAVDIKHPQAVMYEPMQDGKLSLIAVEYITPKGPASLEWQLFNFNGASNRYGLGPFYELHVGVEGEPARHVCGHEHEGDMRARARLGAITN